MLQHNESWSNSSDVMLKHNLHECESSASGRSGERQERGGRAVCATWAPACSMRIKRDARRCGCRRLRRPRDGDGERRFSPRTGESTGRGWPAWCSPQGRRAQRERKYLEQLTHPEIAGLLRRQAEALAAAGVEIAVLDAPLLVEAGWDDWCEKTVFVEAPPEVRLAGRWPAVGRRRILRPARARRNRWIISVRAPM